ncbi:chromosomal replication initiator protein DnaA [Acidimicrobium ferrooxidans DSM 10331]|uniref:Chromosomal replication initiator protein DnaA n=1 Tax=Acidimicrobium ferrooxidans (strain DSM 10331 / JCM 15462 / NBRC 103882 / ICP) TaxID=525909 RepID=C7M114_ACIFD|nr:chromosomal replication initiator protein DnaA [Acidimicrobium ferrooxidans]ACU52976.1 chromosomal replication initiator protein DnaA [Acidimicrobium ferrooxidans DSM 10331]
MSAPEASWEAIAQAFRTAVGEATWLTWFRTLAPQELSDQQIVLTTPSPLAKERLETKYRDVLEDVLTPIMGARVPVAVRVRADVPDETPTTAHSLFDSSPTSSPTPSRRNGRGSSSTFDPRYTFEAFVIGSSNRFAHAAALSVAETPARSYNPLFIHGDAGLGKTHLLHAIGNYARENYPNLLTTYVSTETFLNEFVDAIKRNQTSEFKARYRACDILLVDDIQFLEGKEAIQEEFFHTFNTLYGAQKQIVLTSDRPPRALATLEDRLRSRFAMGLITDVQPPDLETRAAILRRKAEDAGVTVPATVIEFIAASITDNIRELEGALTRLAAFSTLSQTGITLTMAEQVLSDLISQHATQRQRTPAEVIAATAALFNLTPEDITGASRKRPVAVARQIAMYVVRELTELSYPEIGRAFGGKDHTTVMHAVSRVQELMQESVEIYEQVDQLFKSLRGPRP